MERLLKHAVVSLILAILAYSLSISLVLGNAPQKTLKSEIALQGPGRVFIIPLELALNGKVVFHWSANGSVAFYVQFPSGKVERWEGQVGEHELVSENGIHRFELESVTGLPVDVKWQVSFGTQERDALLLATSVVTFVFLVIVISWLLVMGTREQNMKESVPRKG